MQGGEPVQIPGPGRTERARWLTRWGFALDGLSVRLALGFTLCVIVPLFIGLSGLMQHHHNRVIEGKQRSAQLQNRVLEVALRHQMMEKDASLLTSILDEIAAQPDVTDVMILDHEGEIRVASNPDLVGETIPRDDSSCLVCHAKEPSERESWVLLERGQGSLMRSVLPIFNRPECHQCHDPETRINGILLVDTPLNELYAGLRRDAVSIILGTAVLAIALVAGASFLVRRLILVRLSKLRRAARSIAAGNLADRADVTGDDMISSLALDFNHMADAVSRLVTELRDQESRLASVMSSLTDGLVVLDREGRVIASNRSFCRRLGMHPETLRGQSCRSAGAMALPCCRIQNDCPARLCMTSGEVQRITYQTPAEDGGVDRVEEVYASPVFDDNGEVVQVVELWRDITERVKEEERLAEIERLVSLGALASGFSHEVNTPLASMLTCAEGVMGRIDQVGSGIGAESILPDIRDCADTIRSEVLRCRRITEQFLRFSRGIPPSTEPLDLLETVASVVALVGPTARDANVELRLEEMRDLPAVAANVEVVQHVLLNLLINAIQSCEHHGGNVVVKFHVNEVVHIRVQDTGCGIAPEARERLFEPFHSWKTNGTGLGLFLSRSFMRRFGGDVCLAESTLGEGSSFEVRFAPGAEAVARG